MQIAPPQGLQEYPALGRARTEHLADLRLGLMVLGSDRALQLGPFLHPLEEMGDCCSPRFVGQLSACDRAAVQVFSWVRVLWIPWIGVHWIAGIWMQGWRLMWNGHPWISWNLCWLIGEVWVLGQDGLIRLNHRIHLASHIETIARF